MKSVLRDRAILDDERAVADFGEVLVVSDDDEGDAVLGGEIYFITLQTGAGVESPKISRQTEMPSLDTQGPN